jgi:uncharacterized protein
MVGDRHQITRGYLTRHLPPRSRLGFPIATIDIAQDFLLAHLVDQGVFDLVTFKGGTAIRKLYAGAQGRFSTDIDLATVEVGVDRNEIAQIVASASDVTLGPFTFQPTNERNRWQIGVRSEFGDPDIKIKLDVGPPTWIQRTARGFTPILIHSRYGFPLPTIPSMHLEEIMAEKVARLARKATARDASDLIWIAGHSPHSLFNRNRVRRLAVLKTWVDNHGLQPGWESAIAAVPFRPDAILATNREWDDENIGLLTAPPPRLSELEADLQAHFAWLRNLATDEERWATADARHRGEVLRAIRELSEGALGNAYLY